MRDPDKSFGPHNVLVIRPGDTCWIGKEIKGKVVGVSMRAAGMGEMSIQYHVSWWSGNDRKTEWLEEHEVEANSPNGPFMRIGFAAAGNGNH